MTSIAGLSQRFRVCQTSSITSATRSTISKNSCAIIGSAGILPAFCSFTTAGETPALPEIYLGRILLERLTGGSGLLPPGHRLALCEQSLHAELVAFRFRVRLRLGRVLFHGRKKIIRARWRRNAPRQDLIERDFFPVQHAGFVVILADRSA